MRRPVRLKRFRTTSTVFGYLGKRQVQEQCTLMDTHSHPGYLMLKLLGPGGDRRVKRTHFGAEIGPT